MSGFQEAENPNDSANFVVDQLLEDIENIIAGGKSSFRTNNVAINRYEVMELINQIRERLPEEIATARWLLKERKLFVEKIQQEKGEIIKDAQRRAAELVGRVEVVREAQEKARAITQDANEEVARMKSEIDKYCEKQLERFEGILAKVYDEVQLGRLKLQSNTQEVMTETQIGAQSELNFQQEQFQQAQIERVERAELKEKIVQEQESLKSEFDPLLG